jgi:hypothetical protein
LQLHNSAGGGTIAESGSYFAECESRERRCESIMSSENQNPAADEVAALIRKELRREANKRFLRRMPAFQAEQDIPEEFRLLLSQLDSAEARARRKS